MQVWCTLKFKTFVFFVSVQVWCTLKFKTCVFFVPVQVWCTLQLKPSVCFVPVEVGMTHGLLSNCLISQGIGIVCLKVMFFHCFCWFPDSGFLQILLDLERELNLIKRHFVFKDRVSFLRKLYILEQGLLHHKRTRPVKGNANQNRKESRSWFLERRMLLRHSLRCVQTV